jgi:hypothetical protein
LLTNGQPVDRSDVSAETALNEIRSVQTVAIQASAQYRLDFLIGETPEPNL